MKIALFYTGSTGFPLGDAYTNRVLSLAKGLVANGCDVKLYIIYPGRESGVKSRKGVYDTVRFEYLTCRKTLTSMSLKKLIGAWGIIHGVLKLLFSRGIDTVITFTESFIQNKPLSVAAKIRGITFVREINEFPRPVLKRGGIDISPKENRKILRRIAMCDALICISHGLSNYFLSYHAYANPILIVPITVDIDRFSQCQSLAPEKVITYCGNLYVEKDGVDILLQAFQKIAKKHTEYKLKLVGRTDKRSEYANLQKRIVELNLADRVIFTGYVERDAIPGILCSSSILVLARPDNIQAQGGFPTKLGEYLATGRPVIVTSVGDIPKYIKDGINGYLADPGSIKSFAEKLDYILGNYDKAAKVGVLGKELAETEFDHRYQAKRIVNFISELKRN